MENGQIALGAWGKGAGASPVHPMLQMMRDGKVFATVTDETFDFRSAEHTDVWVHVIAFRRRDTIGLRIDGRETTSKVSGSVGEPATFHLAEQSSGYPWQGTVDEVGKWNRALTCCEMDALYAGGAGDTLP